MKPLTSTARITMGIIVVAILFAASAQVTWAESTAPDYVDTSAWHKWVQAYREIAELSQAGINVTLYVQKLRWALQLIERGNYEEAESIIDQIEPELQKLYASKDNYVLLSNIRKYVIVAIVLSIPLLFYHLFPRIYLEVWYRLKRNWMVIENESTR